MTIDEIERLAARCAAAGIGEIELARGGFSLRLRIASGGAMPVAVEEPEAQPPARAVRAPGVGVFRLAHPATGRPLGEPGRAVRKGDAVGVLQLGQCLKMVAAPADGRLGAALVADGAVVGYGTPLYELL